MGREDLEEVAELAVLGLEVPQRHVRVDAVVVAPPDPLPGQISGLDEIPDDALDGALGDPQPLGDVDHPDVRVLGDAQQHEQVVGDERPAGIGPVRST